MITNYSRAIKETSYARRLLDREIHSKPKKNTKMTAEEEKLNALRIQYAKASVRLALSSVRSTKKSIELRKKTKQMRKKLRNRSKLSQTARNRKTYSSSDNGQQEYQDYVQVMEGTATETSQNLTTAQPIMDDFTELLQMPDLDQFNAAMDIAPILGWKKVDSEYKIMYMSLVEDAESSTGESSEWAQFDSFPADASVSDGSQIFLFPHLGNLMLSVDGKLWRLKPTNQGDTVRLNAAVHDFRLMYEETWEFVSDDALPSNTINVIPYARQIADDEPLETACIILTSESKFLKLTSNDFIETNDWVTLTPLNSSHQRTWEAAAYQASCIAAYANGNSSDPSTGSCMFMLSPDLLGNTYTINSDETVQDTQPLHAKYFSCNDVGLVSERTSGKLYQRIVKSANNDPEQMEVSWQPLLDVDGVKSIGVASPGVLADLKMVVTHLRARYMNVQSYIMNTNEDIVSASRLNAIYLDDLMTNAEEYANGNMTSDEVTEAGKQQIEDVQMYARMMEDAIEDSQENTQELLAEFNEIDNSLQSQLNKLENDLEVLEAQLDTLNEAKQKLMTSLIISIVAIVIGVAVIVVGSRFSSKTAMLAGGAILLGGIVGLGFAISGIAELQAQITQTEQLIDQTSTSIDNLNQICALWDEIGEGYEALAVYWQDMDQYANDLTTFTEYGEYILSDKRTIQACIDSNDAILDNTKDYNSMLASQGITPAADAAYTRKRDSLITKAMKCLKAKDRMGAAAALAELWKLRAEQKTKEKGAFVKKIINDGTEVSLKGKAKLIASELEEIVKMLREKKGNCADRVRGSANDFLLNHYERIGEEAEELVSYIH